MGAKDWIGHRTYALILYPGQARQLAAAGFTRESLTRYIEQLPQVAIGKTKH